MGKDKLDINDISFRSIAKVIIVPLILLLSGCAITNEIYLPQEDGLIDKDKPEIVVKQSGPAGFIYRKKADGIWEVEVDSRKPTLWESVIGPVIGKTADSTTGNVTMK